MRGRLEFRGTAAPADAKALATIRATLDRASGLSDWVTIPGRVIASLQFETPSTWHGRYFIRASSVPAWTFEGAIHEGRDVSQTPLDLSSDIADGHTRLH